MNNQIEGTPATSTNTEKPVEEQRKIKMPHIVKKILSYVIPLLVVATIFVVILFLANAKIGELEAKLRAALQETEHIEITNVHIEEKLSKISELATMSFTYTGHKTIDNTRQILGVDIFGTTNTVDVIYSGVIKVGYDVLDTQYKVDEDRRMILFTLPEAKVLDNYIILDNLICEDENNIFNPIGSEDITRYFAEIEEEELAIAESKGIYFEAETQLKSIIENFFAAFPDYKVIFTD